MEECPQCGQSLRIVDLPAEHLVRYECQNCGYEEHDGYEDLYGCMSVPWGFLL